MRSLNILLSVAFAISLAACGSGGSSTPTAVSVTSSSASVANSTSVSSSSVALSSSSIRSSASAASSSSASLLTAGVFDVNYGQFTGVYTFLDNGKFSGIHFVNGDSLAGHPHGTLSPTNATNSMEHIAWANFIDDSARVGAQEAAGRFGRTFTATGVSVAIQGSMGNFAALATQQKMYGNAKTFYNDPISLDIIKGTYIGVVRTVGINTPIQTVTQFIIESDGTFNTTVGNCSFKGKLIAHGNTGIFDTDVTVSGASCSFPGTMNGLTTPIAYANNVPQLALQLDDVNNAFAAVFVITKSVGTADFSVRDSQ